MKETIVIETMFTEVPFEQRFAEIRKAGYRYAELWNLNGRDPRAVRRLADESGVEIIGLSGDISGRPGAVSYTHLTGAPGFFCPFSNGRPARPPASKPR